jgi:methionine-rich copper-binding protein CopC
LSWFFNEWVFNGGAPAYAAGWQTFSSGGQNYLRLSLRQTQTSPIFTMPVDVRITYSGGTKTVVVNSDASTDWFVIPIPAAATAVAIDPDTWILTTATATSETYRAGPAKVIQASPAPNDSLPTPPASLSVSFSENVNIPNGAITLTGPSGSVPITVSYSGTTFIATITPNSPLSGGTYTLNFPATITSVNGGAALDGELGAGATPFPTGNGNAGGNATWSFIVQNQTPVCYANCDGSTSSPILTASDFTCFLTAFRNGDAYANCDGSTDAPVLTASDFTCFLTQFRAGCP